MNIDCPLSIQFYSFYSFSFLVNSIRFHPTDSLVCTGKMFFLVKNILHCATKKVTRYTFASLNIGSGDGSCHIWKVQIPTISDLKSKSPLESPAVGFFFVWRKVKQFNTKNTYCFKSKKVCLYPIQLALSGGRLTPPMLYVILTHLGIISHIFEYHGSML